MSNIESSLNRRMYKLLGDWKYNITILNKNIENKQKYLKLLNASMITLSILSIAGWFQFEKHKIIWSCILSTIQVFRIIKNLFIFNESDLINIQKSLDFYIYNLEDLFYDFHSRKLAVNLIEVKFNELLTKERNLILNQKFHTISDSKQLILLGEKSRDLYLEKIKNNI